MLNKSWRKTDPRKEIRAEVRFVIARPSIQDKCLIFVKCYIRDGGSIYYDSSSVYHEGDGICLINNDWEWPRKWFWTSADCFDISLLK
jgi:hypothetical protein